MRAVDVGHKVHGDGALRVVLEGLADHHGAEIGSANANVDNVGDRLASVAFPVAVAHGVGKGAHVGEHGVHAGHHVLAVDEDGAVRTVTEGDMKDGAALGKVNLVAGKHAVALGGDARLLDKGNEIGHDRLVNPVLGHVHEHRAVGRLKRPREPAHLLSTKRKKNTHALLKARRVSLKLLAHIKRLLLERVGARLERPPCLQLCRLHPETAVVQKQRR